MKKTEQIPEEEIHIYSLKQIIFEAEKTKKKIEGAQVLSEPFSDSAQVWDSIYTALILVQNLAEHLNKSSKKE